VTIQKASQRDVYLVSPLWVEACRVKMVQVSEALFPISNEYQKKFSLEHGNGVFPRKVKSMQPREFEDDILIAEAKLRRKRKIQNEPPDNSNDVAIPFFSPLPNPLLRSPSERLIQASPLSSEDTGNRQEHISDSSVVSHNNTLPLDLCNNSCIEESSEVSKELSCQKTIAKSNVPTTSRTDINNLTPSTSEIKKK
ncbi:hypothetical protein Anas_08360, partial [Armadillidium nasatum]